MLVPLLPIYAGLQVRGSGFRLSLFAFRVGSEKATRLPFYKIVPKDNKFSVAIRTLFKRWDDGAQSRKKRH